IAAPEEAALMPLAEQDHGGCVRAPFLEGGEDLLPGFLSGVRVRTRCAGDEQRAQQPGTQPEGRGVAVHAPHHPYFPARAEAPRTAMIQPSSERRPCPWSVSE